MLDEEKVEVAWYMEAISHKEAQALPGNRASHLSQSFQNAMSFIDYDQRLAVSNIQTMKIFITS